MEFSSCVHDGAVFDKSHNEWVSARSPCGQLILACFQTSRREPYQIRLAETERHEKIRSFYLLERLANYGSICGALVGQIHDESVYPLPAAAATSTANGRTLKPF